MGLMLHGPYGTRVRFAPYTPYGHHMGQVDLVWAIFGPCHIIPTLIPYNPSWAHKPPSVDSATSSLHLPLFSAALCDAANSSPVHSFMLSSHVTVPCRMVFKGICKAFAPGYMSIYIPCFLFNCHSFVHGPGQWLL